MDAIYTEQYKGFTIEIHQDDDALNPRKEFDNASHFVCWHRRYDLGDKHNYADASEFLVALAREVAPDKADKLTTRYDDDKITEQEYRSKLSALIDKNVVMLELYLYDHSGITISTSAFNDPWDSGQVGFAYMARADVIKEFDKWDKRTREKARKLILGEVETYDDYLTDNVWGYVVKDENDEHVDSCWGYFGDYDDEDYGALKEAYRSTDHLAKERDERIAAKDAQLSKSKMFFHMGG